MPARRKEIAPELVAKGQQLYENTLTPMHAIATMMGISRATLDVRINEWNWTRRRYSSAGIATPDGPPDADAPPAPLELSADFVVRLTRVINCQMDVVERMLKVLKPVNDAEAERVSRTLAVISRTVQEIKATANSAGATPPDETDDDPIPRDIDEFRFALARRIRGFIEARQNGADRLSGDAEAELD